MSVIKPVTIEKKSEVKQSHAHDFETLRQQAIDLLQQMAGNTWTDYNLHDPGVTVMEQLCYAITDLAYRTSFPIQDLLADQHGRIDYDKNSFHTPDEMLFSRPVTANDFRKILIDRIKEIDNVWLTPVYSRFASNSVKGVYRATVQVSRETAKKWHQDEGEEQRVKDLIRSVFVSERNLCEDISQNINVLRPVKIRINAEVLIEENVQPEVLLAQIYHNLQTMISAKVKYYTEDELVSMGYQTEEIYAGPRLSNGIIPDKELKPQKKEIDPIEIIQCISKIKGVIQVKTVTIDGSQTDANKPYRLDDTTFPYLDDAAASGIKLFTSKFQVHIKQSLFNNLLIKLDASRDRVYVTSFYKAQDDAITGRHLNTGKYYSIQHNFPHIYGIGRDGLPSKERTAARRGQVKQLKAYLVLFEQLLANYLANLNHIEDYFCCTIPKTTDTAAYYQPLYDVPDLAGLLKSFTDSPHSKNAYAWESFVDDKKNGYLELLKKLSDNDIEYRGLKKEQLDHLLARFNVVLVDYPVKLYRQMYRFESVESRFSDELKWKRFYLSNIVNIQRGETRGLNYLGEVNNSTTFNFEKKIRLLLCLFGYNNTHKLSAVFENEQMTFEVPRKYQSSEPPPLQAAEESVWVEDVAEIFMSQQDAEALFKRDVNIRTDIADGQFYFANRGTMLYMEAVDYKNYKIIPDFTADKQGFLLLFKYAADSRWDIISKYISEEHAITSLKKLVHYFRNLSLKSEGLYIVEHVLLRPSVASKSFSFRLMDDLKVLYRDYQWVDFAERENDIRRAITRFDNKPGITTELFVRGINGEIIDESFFSFQITVVLPSWPARFQDKNFKEFIKSIILLNVPANIKVNFKWLSPSKMAAFEDDYLSWKELYKEREDSNRSMIAGKLVAFLQN